MLNSFDLDNQIVQQKPPPPQPRPQISAHTPDSTIAQNDKIVLVRARDIDVPRWSIAEVDQKGHRSTVRIVDQFGIREMVFLDYPSALRFMYWMKKWEAKFVGKRAFTFSDAGTQLIQTGKYPELSVEVSSETTTASLTSQWKCESSIIN